jgi:hypothetical protein
VDSLAGLAQGGATSGLSAENIKSGVGAIGFHLKDDLEELTQSPLREADFIGKPHQVFRW